MSSIILASGSYQRQRLLAMLGIEFVSTPSDFDEYAVKLADFANHTEYVTAIAAGKVLAVAGQHQRDDSVVIGGDLVCFTADRQPLGKPRSYDQARIYLDLLGDTHHQEVSAVGIWSAAQGWQGRAELIEVDLPLLAAAEKEVYLAEADPLNKAGGFSLSAYAKAIRRRGEDPAQSIRIQGPVTGIIGLPVTAAAQLLSAYGHRPPTSAKDLEKRLTGTILAGEPL